MELFDVIRAMCTRNGKSISNDDKKKFSFILKRLYAAGVPLQCNMLNQQCVDQKESTEILISLSKQYLNIPGYLQLRVSQKKKQGSIYKDFEDKEIEKFCWVNQCSEKILQQCYNIDPAAVKSDMKLIRDTFFPKDEKIILSKTKG